MPLSTSSADAGPSRHDRNRTLGAKSLAPARSAPTRLRHSAARDGWGAPWSMPSASTGRVHPVHLGLRRDKEIEEDSPRKLAAASGGPIAEQWRLDELHRHFALELGASTSLNTRGTQLAALTGVIIGLLGTVAKDRELTCLTWLLLATAGIGLAVAAAAAIGAVYPHSKWRKDLHPLVLALSAEISVSEHDGSRIAQPIPGVVSRLLTMVETQRHTNETKARRMRFAYLGLALGLGASAAAVVALLLADPASASTAS
jgi:hypothetical protein